MAFVFQQMFVNDFAKDQMDTSITHGRTGTVENPKHSSYSNAREYSEGNMLYNWILNSCRLFANDTDVRQEINAINRQFSGDRYI